MLERPTVLILGAGSSAEFGLPTGIDLGEDVAKRCAFFFAHGGPQTGGLPEVWRLDTVRGALDICDQDGGVKCSNVELQAVPTR